MNTNETTSGQACPACGNTKLTTQPGGPGEDFACGYCGCRWSPFDGAVSFRPPLLPFTPMVCDGGKYRPSAPGERATHVIAPATDAPPTLTVRDGSPEELGWIFDALRREPSPPLK